MDPITIGLLLAGAGQIAQRVGAGVGNEIRNRPLESQQDRIDELKRLQEADALGLTGDQRAAYMASFVDPQRAIAAQQLDQNRALQAGLQDSGRALAGLRRQEEQTQRVVADANRQIEMQNQIVAQQQEQELRTLQLQDEMRQRELEAGRMEAIIGGVGDVANIGAQAYAQQELINRGPMDPAARQLANTAGLASPYGYNYNMYMNPQGLPPGSIFVPFGTQGTPGTGGTGGTGSGGY